MDINKLTPRQLVAGLMRGNADEFKMGYSPEAATHAVAGRFNLSPLEFNKLLSYAEGFADGLVEDGSNSNMPARKSEAVTA